MARRRSYRLLCPVARALDVLGDRWSLLILRDLHAGPARFSDLQGGFPGLATNLLTDRLRQLEQDGLVVRRKADFGAAVYELTEQGRATRAVLWELAQFGGELPRPEEPRRPHNLRTVAVTLSEACSRVVPPALRLNAEIRIDGEAFALTAGDGRVSVVYGQATAPQVVVETSYEPFMDLGDGLMSLETFARDHRKVVAGEPDEVAALFGLISGAIALLTGAENGDPRS